MIKMTFEFRTYREIAAFLEKINPTENVISIDPNINTDAVTVDTAVHEKQETEVKPSRKASKKQSRKSKPDTDTPAKKAELKAPSKDDVRQALSQVGAKHGIDTVREICQRFGASGVRDLPEDRYADVIKKCEEVQHVA